MGEIVRFMLRLKPAFHKSLAKIAEREHRSLHAQLLHFLEWAVAEYKKKEKEDLSRVDLSGGKIWF